MATSKTLQLVLELKDQASKELGGVSNQFGKIAKYAAAAGIATMGAIGVKSVLAAVAFQDQMQNIATIVDTSTESMEAMGDAVKEVALGTSVPIEELTGSLYDIRSAGIDASGAMDVLATAADLSVAGLSSAGEATNILTSAINSFGYEGAESEKVAGILFTTVKAGKTTIADLAQSFGMVAPIASTAGIALEELQAATAALTTTGQTASIAQTQLKAAILAIQAPTDQMKDLFKDAGIESGQLALKNEGLVSVMEKVVTAANGDAEALKKAMGSSEALSATLALTGEQGEAFYDTMGMMEDGVDSLTSAVEEQEKSVKKQWENLKNQFHVALIDLGEYALPYATKAMGALSETLKEVTEDLSDGEIQMKSTDSTMTFWIKNTIKFFQLAYKAIYKTGEAIAWATDKFAQFGTAFAEFVLDMIKGARDWGVNMIKAFAEGIAAAAAYPIEAVKSVFGKLANYMPHSPAKEGPLKNIVKWGQNTILGFAEGMRQENATVTNAATEILSETESLFVNASKDILKIREDQAGETIDLMQKVFDARKDMAEKTVELEKDLQEDLKSITASGTEKAADFMFDTEEKLNTANEEMEDLKKQRRNEDDADRRSSLRDSINEKRAEIKELSAILLEAQKYKIDLTDEYTEVKRRAGLTELERIFDDMKTEREAAIEAFREKKNLISEETKEVIAGANVAFENKINNLNDELLAEGAQKNQLLDINANFYKQMIEMDSKFKRETNKAAGGDASSVGYSAINTLGRSLSNNITVTGNNFMGTPAQLGNQIQQLLQKRLQGSLKF